ncbi:hypothetical protein BJX76DRAFT_329517 [Aspergillus varians]
MSDVPVHEKPEKGTCHIYLGISTKESQIGGRWAVLISSGDQMYSAYYSVSSPSRYSLHEKKVLHNQSSSHYLMIFTTAYRLGCLQEERLGLFLEIFDSAKPGPDQFFAVRFLYGLYQQGILEPRRF